MQIPCDRCGGPTQPKQITSKKDGKQYTVYTCQGGCMAGRFKYSCFAPKQGGSTQQATGNGNGNGGQPGAASASLQILKSIDETLKHIEKILANPQQMHIAESELNPDEVTPF